jgi:hypothetical protein
MFDVIDFLERVGQDAQLRHASRDDVGLALSGAEVDSELRVAILARDGNELRALLGRDPFCCLISPAKPGEEQEDGGSGDEGEEKNDDKDGEKRRDGD